MAYSRINFPSKKKLKEAVVARAAYEKRRDSLAAGANSPELVDVPEQVYAYQPGSFGPDLSDGEHCIEGPHYPKPHRWYATAVVKNGIIKSVR